MHYNYFRVRFVRQTYAVIFRSHFYRAMLRRARLCHSMSSVGPSVWRPSVRLWRSGTVIT